VVVLLPEGVHRVAAEKARVALVDRLDLVLVLEPGEVEVVLPIDRAQERLRVDAIVVHVHALPA
jgi:hypothetical protein